MDENINREHINAAAISWNEHTVIFNTTSLPTGKGKGTIITWGRLFLLFGRMDKSEDSKNGPHPTD